MHGERVDPRFDLLTALKGTISWARLYKPTFNELSVRPVGIRKRVAFGHRI